MDHYSHLLEPLPLGRLTLRNRAVMGSMHTGLEETGEWQRMAEFYAERARGGVGLIVTGGITPNREGAVFPGAAGISSPEEIDGHRAVTQAVHENGGHIAMQILHAGRYGYDRSCVAPSAIRSPISPFTPRRLSEAGISKQISDFAATAAQASEVGYDGVEIMGSEGYLLNQFLVRRTNRRRDRWGGSYQNRMRFPLAVLAAVREAVGDNCLVIFRLSLIDLVPDGSSWEEIVALARSVQSSGADIINTGIGWHESRIPTIATSVPRGAFEWITRKLKSEVEIPVMASNRINTPDLAERVLREGSADLISMARPFLADAEFVAKAASQKAALITPCIACNQACLDHTFERKISSCIVNPRACNERELNYCKAAVPKSIAIIGAGPAGLAAALVASERGHVVTLFEQSSHIGGQFNMARRIPGKAEFSDLVQWYDRMLSEHNVRKRLGCCPEPDDLMEFDEIVVATGVRPRIPQIEGSDTGQVLTYAQVLLEDAEVGNRVVIIGAGGIGFDVAEYLASEKGHADSISTWRHRWGVSDPSIHRGGIDPSGPRPSPPARHVTMLQRKPERPGKGLGKTTGWIHRSSLAMKQVRMLGGVSYDRIDRNGIHVTFRGDVSRQEFIATDTIVLCTGQEPERSLFERMRKTEKRVHLIGGAREAANLDAKSAVAEGTQLAASL